jgi:hypothetical protein
MPVAYLHPPILHAPERLLTLDCKLRDLRPFVVSRSAAPITWNSAVRRIFAAAAILLESPRNPVLPFDFAGPAPVGALIQRPDF